MSLAHTPQPAVSGFTTYAPYEAGYKGPHVPDTSESISPWETYDVKGRDALLNASGVQEGAMTIIEN